MQKILIVEDDQDIAELERDYLEANGYGVEIASDGKEGIRKALEADVDLVLLDIMLPGLDGFQVCRQIREKGTSPSYWSPPGRKMWTRSGGWAWAPMTTS